MRSWHCLFLLVCLNVLQYQLQDNIQHEFPRDPCDFLTPSLEVPWSRATLNVEMTVKIQGPQAKATHAEKI